MQNHSPIHSTSVEDNLKDAGCDEEFICRYEHLLAQQRTQEQLNMLSVYRKKLLDELHTVQKHIDCLDYLIYKTKKA